jgi:hypothetical protein
MTKVVRIKHYLPGNFQGCPLDQKKKKKLPLKNKVEGGRANYLKVVENLKEEVMAKCHRPVT